MILQFEFEQSFNYLSDHFEWEVYIILDTFRPFHLSNVKGMYGGNSEFLGHRQFLRIVQVPEPESLYPINITLINLDTPSEPILNVWNTNSGDES